MIGFVFGLKGNPLTNPEISEAVATYLAQAGRIQHTPTCVVLPVPAAFANPRVVVDLDLGAAIGTSRSKEGLWDYGCAFWQLATIDVVHLAELISAEGLSSRASPNRMAAHVIFLGVEGASIRLGR